jgi:hypothetical protein
MMEKRLFLVVELWEEDLWWGKQPGMQNVTKIQNDWNIFVTETR